MLVVVLKWNFSFVSSSLSDAFWMLKCHITLSSSVFFSSFRFFRFPWLPSLSHITLCIFLVAVASLMVESVNQQLQNERFSTVFLAVGLLIYASVLVVSWNYMFAKIIILQPVHRRFMIWWLPFHEPSRGNVVVKFVALVACSDWWNLRHALIAVACSMWCTIFSSWIVGVVAVYSMATVIPGQSIPSMASPQVGPSGTLAFLVLWHIWDSIYSTHPDSCLVDAE